MDFWGHGYRLCRYAMRFRRVACNASAWIFWGMAIGFADTPCDFAASFRREYAVIAIYVRACGTRYARFARRAYVSYVLVVLSLSRESGDSEEREYPCEWMRERGVLSGR